MRITNPEINVILFSNEDVIATSGIEPTLGLFYLPTENFAGSYTGTGDNVEFNGYFTNDGSGNYLISNIYGAKAGVDYDMSLLTSPQSGLVFINGTPIPAAVIENIAKTTYVVTSYDNGVYYTNGRTYYENYWQ